MPRSLTVRLLLRGTANVATAPAFSITTQAATLQMHMLLPTEQVCTAVTEPVTSWIHKQAGIHVGNTHNADQEHTLRPNYDSIHGVPTYLNLSTRLIGILVSWDRSPED